MKSERRHELQTNELAESLGRLVTGAKTHGRTMAYALVLAAVVAAGMIAYPMIRQHRQATAATAFTEAFFGAGTDLQPLRDFLVDYAGDVRAPLARLALADHLLNQAVLGVSVKEGEDPKAKAAASLAEAKTLYTEVAQNAPAQEALARVGLALVTVQEGDVEQGRTLLSEVLKQWPGSLAAVKAEVHLQELAGYKPMAFSDEPLEQPKPAADAPPAPPAVPLPASSEQPKTEKSVPAEPTPKG